MPSVPLGVEAYQRQRGIVPETILQNYYLEEDKSGGSLDQVMRLQRPGLTALHRIAGKAIRGIFQMDGVLANLTYFVAADTLYSTDWSTATAIGTLTNDGLSVAMAARDGKLGIVTSGEFWTYDGSTLAQIDLPDGKAPIDLDVLNGYFILPLSSGTFYWLAPDQDDFTSADAILQFATAESIPDGLFGVRRLRDEFMLFGTRNIEVWQSTGLSDATFERAQGRTIDRGAHSRECIANFDNTVVFVGDDGLVYRLEDVPKRISTHGIEERIARRTDQCSAFVFTADGHKFYCLTIPGEGTFAFDASTEAWSQFSSLGQSTWALNCALDTPYGSLAGDASGNVFKIDSEATTDDGTAIERIVTGTIAIPPTRVANSHLALWIGADSDAAISLRWKDGLDTVWSSPVSLTARAGSDVVHAWRLGSARGAFRTFEISTTANTILRISGALANEGRKAA